MRLIYLTTSFLFLNICLFAQDRTNKSLPKISIATKGQLVKAIGWTLNPEGQWISRQNRIPVFLENEFKSLIDYERDGLGIDNFISYQLKEIKIEDKTYSILIKKYKDGEFKYPSIKEGWMNYTRLCYYVFETTELEKLKTLKNDSINLFTLKILYTNALDWGVSYRAETYLSDIEKDIVTKMKEATKSKTDEFLAFHIAPFKNKKLIRFQIYYIQQKSYGTGNTIGGIISEFTVKESSTSLSEGKQVYSTDKLFKHCYYETDYTTFMGFLKVD